MGFVSKLFAFSFGLFIAFAISVVYEKGWLPFGYPLVLLLFGLSGLVSVICFFICKVEVVSGKATRWGLND